MCRRGHPFPVHMRRGELRREDSPPQSPGGLRDPNQRRELLRTSPRCTGTRTDVSCADALQKCLRDALLAGRHEAVRWLPGHANAWWTVRIPCSQCSSNATECAEQSSHVARCSSGHLRLCVEALVGNQLKDYDALTHIFVHFVNVFETYLRGMFTGICLCLYGD